MEREFILVSMHQGIECMVFFNLKKFKEENYIEIIYVDENPPTGIVVGTPCFVPLDEINMGKKEKEDIALLWKERQKEKKEKKSLKFNFNEN